MTTRLLIKGAEPRPPQGSPYPRLEIHEFIRHKNIKQYSLYIQALQAIYERAGTNVASYFQISGIHGLPQVPWDGAPGPGFYCVHNSLIFSMWHRPYVALFEQEIQRLAREKAEQYPVEVRATWLQAAAQLRQPYWAWDSDETFIPPLEVIVYERVQIVTPTSNGGLVSVPNPFLAYGFRTGETATFPSPFTTQMTTLRHPKNNETRPATLINALAARKTSIIENSGRLHSVTNFRDFTFGSGSTSGLEAIHGSIHVAVGGMGGPDGQTQGHMSSVPVAAFDPIFWLHHTQVDRILQGWFSVHGDWPPNTDDLIPFWRTPTTFWKSSEVQYPAPSFNYRFGSLDFGDSATSEVQGAVAQLAANRDAVIQEWSTRVNCKLFEVGGSFSVYIFLGDVPTDPTKWLSDPAFAGIYDVFANDDPAQCPTCNDKRDLVVSGFVHLNQPILERSSKITLNDGDVVPLLKKRLHWAVQRAKDGAKIEVEKNFPSLEVTVLRTPLTLPTGAKHPYEGKPVYYHDITRDHAGGYKGKYKYEAV